MPGGSVLSVHYHAQQHLALPAAPTYGRQVAVSGRKREDVNADLRPRELRRRRLVEGLLRDPQRVLTIRVVDARHVAAQSQPSDTQRGHRALEEKHLAAQLGLEGAGGRV